MATDVTEPEAGIEMDEEFTEEVDDLEEENAQDEAEGEEAPAPATVDDLLDMIGSQIERTVDSRIGKLMGTLKKDYGLERGKERTSPPRPEASGDDRLSARLLRSAVADEIGMMEFDSVEERRAARDMALRLAESTPMSEGEDEYEVAGRIATTVEQTLGSLKETYQKQLRRDLERRGVLRDDEEQQPQRTKGSGAMDAQKQYDRGAELARKKYANRIKED